MRLSTRTALTVAAAAVLFTACGDPSDVAGWAKRASSRSRTPEKLEALDQARKAPGDKKAAVPYLVEILKQAPKPRAAAALLLGEAGDPAAAKPMIDAIDLAARDRDTLDANRRLAEALGQLKARDAVPALLKLTASTDAYCQIAAVDALGMIGDPGAIDTLAGIARSDAVEPATAAHALIALGKIGDVKAAPVLLRMMSVYPQASIAVVQIGKPMTAPLLAVLEGKDSEFDAWAREAKVAQGRVYAKMAQLLGEVGAQEAVPALLARLSYKDADAEMEQEVRVFSARALGLLRAKQAVQPISELLARADDPDARIGYAEALTRIGDPAALPALRAAAGKGGFIGRYGPLAALSRMGGAAELPLVDGAAAAACEDEKAELCRERARELAAMKARLGAAAACADVKCWAGKLADPSPAVRDRAALQVGWAGTAADAPALAKAMLLQVDDELGADARGQAVLALRWIADREALGETGRGIAGQIDGMIAADRGRRLTAEVDDGAVRLAARLRKQ